MFYTCKLLLLLLGYVSAVAVGLAVIVILYTGFLMRSRGLTREDGRRGMKAFVVFFVCLFASIGCFAGVYHLQQNHDREMIDGARALMAECEQLGDAQPIPAPTKALVWDLKTDSRSKANDCLRDDLQAGWNDDMLIFLVQDSNASLLELDVWVVRWPQKEAIGKYTVRDSLTPAQRKQLKESDFTLRDLDTAIIYWIQNLPDRPRGDGPDLRQRKLDAELPGQKKE